MKTENSNSREIIQNPPLFAFVDLQSDFTGSSKRSTLKHLEECMRNCKLVLDYARQNNLPIAHFRRLHKDQLSVRKPNSLHWLEDFKPMYNEMIFERSLPSCYSSKPFSKLISTIRNPHIILLGLTGPQACLSTAIDAYHHNHDLTFISDGSVSPALKEYCDKKTHNFISEVINLYSRVLKAGEFIKQQNYKACKKHKKNS